MSEFADTAFVYDQTFDGLLTCVFDAYQLKTFPTHLLAANEPAPLFCTVAHTVTTDEQKSVRVWTALEKKLSKSALHSLTVSWLADGISDVDELIFRYIRKTTDAKTTICCTRYGNVMASRGSVIPLWVDQMEEGKPITITDPQMTRFMMTLNDAVDLVIYAFEHGKNGDLFVQKAPAATLDVLAEALKQTYAQIDPKYGKTEVKVIGTRHGEKIYETLVTREEMARAIDMGDYYRIPCDGRDLNYDKVEGGNPEIDKMEEYHSHNTKRLTVEEMKELLLKLTFIREDLGLQPRAHAKEIRSE